MSSGAGRIVVHYLEQILARVGVTGFVEMDAEISSEFDDADRRVERLEERIKVLEDREAAREQRAAIGGFLFPPLDGIHEAGVLLERVQLCRRCSAVLSDYRGAMQLSSDPPLTGYKPGASVETAGPGSWVTEAARVIVARLRGVGLPVWIPDWLLERLAARDEARARAIAAEILRPGEIVVCPSCRVPFTRHGGRSSDFYRTRAENDTCIVCREGLDPVTLEPLAGRKGQP